MIIGHIIYKIQSSRTYLEIDMQHFVSKKSDLLAKKGGGDYFHQNLRYEILLSQGGYDILEPQWLANIINLYSVPNPCGIQSESA